MEIKLLKSKLLVPKPSDILFRERINGKVQRIENKKLILLEAGAGFGKTTALSLFLENANIDSTWYKIGNFERDYLLFIRYLVSGLQIHYEDFCCENIEQQYLSYGHHAVFSYFASEIEKKITRPHCIVLDDWHIVNEVPLIVEFIDYLIENTHDNIHFLLTSRTRPGLQFARLLSSQQAIIISEDELKFTPSETEFFFKTMEEKDTKTLALQAYDKTQGWAAGLRLLSQTVPLPETGSIKTPKDDFFKYIKGSDKIFSQYLEETVFNSLSNSDQKFLTVTSVLSLLNPDVCDRLMEIDYSVQILEKLENRHLFITIIDPENQIFVYHQLLKDFLRTRLKKKFTKKERQKIHIKAAHIFIDEGQWEKAAFHFHTAGCFDELEKLLIKFGTKSVYSGHSSMIQSFLDLLPNDLLKKSPWLLLCQALI